MNESPLRAGSALLPIAMSLIGLGMVIGYVALFGAERHQDEGLPARIFQLLMVAQLPIIAFFAARWLPRAPGRTLLVLGLQAAAAASAIAAVLFFESM